MNAPVHPSSGMRLTQDTTFAPGIYHVTEPITIEADGVTLDGQGALLIGDHHQGSAIVVGGRNGVTIKNVQMAGYYHALRIEESAGITVEACRVRDTHEIAGPDVFIDIWRDAERAYGAALRLSRVSDSRIRDCDFQHNQNGVLMYECSEVEVRGNNASFCSGFGVHLYASSGNRIEGNICDHVNRVYRRPNGSIFVGADAAGLLMVYDSHRNIVRGNAFRCGGDGIFLAGLSPHAGPHACNDNLFEDNDCSLSPNNAIEATFARGNIFRRNLCNESNYGFWGGYSWDSLFEENECCRNRIAGIAIEHGQQFTLRGNVLDDNGEGISLWTRPENALGAGYPTSAYTGHYRILDNKIRRSRIGIHVEAQGASEEARDLQITGNLFADNVWAVRLRRARDIALEANEMRGSLVADEDRA